jgi:adenylate kinase
MIIFACGLSRSGKSTLIDEAEIGAFGVGLLRASALLQAAGRPISRLRATDVLSNQTTFVAAVIKRMRTAENLLIDGHLIVETIDGPQLVPETCLDPLPLAGIIVIEAHPSEVVIRREGTDLAISVEEAIDRMALERIQAQRLARRKGVRCTVVKCGDVANFRDALQQIVTR